MHLVLGIARIRASINNVRQDEWPMTLHSTVIIRHQLALHSFSLCNKMFQQLMYPNLVIAKV
jgi:hypothetical protein